MKAKSTWRGRWEEYDIFTLRKARRRLARMPISSTGNINVDVDDTSGRVGWTLIHSLYTHRTLLGTIKYDRTIYWGPGEHRLAGYLLALATNCVFHPRWGQKQDVHIVLTDMCVRIVKISTFCLLFYTALQNLCPPPKKRRDQQPKSSKKGNQLLLWHYFPGLKAKTSFCHLCLSDKKSQRDIGIDLTTRSSLAESK